MNYLHIIRDIKKVIDSLAEKSHYIEKIKRRYEFLLSKEAYFDEELQDADDILLSGLKIHLLASHVFIYKAQGKKTDYSSTRFKGYELSYIRKKLTPVTVQTFLEYIGHSIEFNNKKKKSTSYFPELQKYMDKLTWQQRENLVMFNGLHFLNGMSPPCLELVYLGRDKLPGVKGWDIIYINDNNVRARWYKNRLPVLLNTDSIYTIVYNINYHFYYNNIKCISFWASIKYAMVHSIIDLFWVKKCNNIDILDKLCIRNIVVSKVSKVYTDKKIEDLYNEIKKKVGDSVLKKYFKRCGEIYKNKVNYINPLTRNQIAMHRETSQKYILQYGMESDILDMGAGKLSGHYIYNKTRSRNVYAVEPSTYSLQMAKEKLSKFKTRTNFVLINSKADIPNLYNKISARVNLITFIFTIHYMMPNIDVLMKNIKDLLLKNGKVIITCIDGNSINQLLKNKDAHEIKYYNDIYWGVYRFGQTGPLSKALFYMKDVYGVEMGSVEPLVDVNALIRTFKKHSLKVIVNQSFKDVVPAKFTNICKFQKEILDLHKVLVFEL